MNRILMVIIVGVFLFSCHNGNKRSVSETSTDLNSAIKTEELKTKSGKIFTITIDYSVSKSICKVKVETKGFENDNMSHDLGTIDPVESVFLADLDKNGFEELYITTRSVGSGSYSGIYGIASNRDKSTSLIYVPDFELKGFMGHNTFEIENEKLYLTYPIYEDGDANAKPNGGTERLEFRLFAGEAGWILQPASL